MFQASKRVSELNYSANLAVTFAMKECVAEGRLSSVAKRKLRTALRFSRPKKSLPGNPLVKSSVAAIRASAAADAILKCRGGRSAPKQVAMI